MVREERANPASIERDEESSYLSRCAQKDRKGEVDAPGKAKYCASLSSAEILVLGLEFNVAFRHSTRSVVDAISKDEDITWCDSVLFSHDGTSSLGLHQPFRRRSLNERPNARSQEAESQWSDQTPNGVR